MRKDAGILSGGVIREMLRRGEIAPFEDVEPSLEISGMKLFARLEKETVVNPGETLEIGLYPGLKLPDSYAVTISPTTTEGRRFNKVRAYVGGKYVAYHPMEFGGEISLRPGRDLKAEVSPLEFPVRIAPGQQIANMRVIRYPDDRFFLDPSSDIENYLFGENGEPAEPRVRGECFSMTVNTSSPVDNGFSGYKSNTGVREAVKPWPGKNERGVFLSGVNPGEFHIIERGGHYLYGTSERLDLTRGDKGKPFVAYMMPHGPDGVVVALAYDIHPEKRDRQALEICPDKDRFLNHGQEICYLLPCRLVTNGHETVSREQKGNRSLMGKLYI